MDQNLENIDNSDSSSEMTLAELANRPRSDSSLANANNVETMVDLDRTDAYQQLLFLMTQLNDKFDGLNNKMDEVKTDIYNKMDDLKTDIYSKMDDVQTGMTQIEQKLNTKIENVQSELKGEIKVVGEEVETKIAKVNQKFDQEVSQISSRVDEIVNKIDTHATEILSIKDYVGMSENTKVGLNGEESKSNLKEESDLLVESNKVQTTVKSVKMEGSGLNQQPACNIMAELYLTEFDEGNDRTHPMNFLKLAEKFTNSNQEHWETKLLYIVKYLKGEASEWARRNIDKWESFEQFKNDFKKRFWGITKQKDFENKLMGNGNFCEGKTDLTNYVLGYFDIAKKLDNQMDNLMFVGFICRHLPPHISASLAILQSLAGREELEVVLNQLSYLKPFKKESFRDTYNTNHENGNRQKTYTGRPTQNFHDSTQGQQYRPNQENRAVNTTQFSHTNDGRANHTNGNHFERNRENNRGYNRPEGFRTFRGRGNYRGGPNYRGGHNYRNNSENFDGPREIENGQD
ncbi:hypothetical protein J6590_102286 [Homalodisca vitripennis]|nr:hypothetical protein J6590_102286 [Homalodisca vitripennis]